MSYSGRVRPGMTPAVVDQCAHAGAVGHGSFSRWSVHRGRRSVMAAHSYREWRAEIFPVVFSRNLDFVHSGTDSGRASPISGESRNFVFPDDAAEHTAAGRSQQIGQVGTRDGTIATTGKFDPSPRGERLAVSPVFDA